MKVYIYQGCSTCRDAIKWLKAHNVKFEEAAIRETPPTVPELRAALKSRDGNLRSLFNTSGMDYRAMGLKEKLPGMSEEESLALLASNGNLVKRPFVIDKTRGIFLSGFKEKEWETAIG